MTSHRTVVVPFLVLSLLVAVAFQIFGSATWKIWNIPTLQPSFVDARIITASAESHRLGFDPELDNPRDPFLRRFNLPAIWKLFFSTKIDQSQTNLFAGFLIASFFIGLLLFFSRINTPSGWLIALCAFSPPVMLALERGNVDLFVFFLCALSLMLVEKSGMYASMLLILASSLKLFPVFGIMSLMKFERGIFLKLSASIVLLLTVVLAVDIANLRHVFSNTEVGSDISYGVGVLPLRIGEATDSKVAESVATSLGYVVFLIVAISAFLFAAREGFPMSSGATFQLASFRLGAGIYLGTFLLGNNWDYRLMFLLFTLPQLLEWWKDHRIARYTLIAVLVSLAYLWIAAILPFAYVIDEFANWLVFGGLFYLFIASAPSWLRSEIRAIIFRSNKRTARV